VEGLLGWLWDGRGVRRNALGHVARGDAQPVSHAPARAVFPLQNLHTLLALHTVQLRPLLLVQRLLYVTTPTISPTGGQPSPTCQRR